MKCVPSVVLLLLLTDIEEGTAELCAKDPCLDVNITSLWSMDRRAAGCGYTDNLCDSYINDKWYSMNIPMYNQCPGLNECGTVFPVWMNGNEPSEADGVVHRDACLVGPIGCCQKTYSLKLKNCGYFVAYCLVHLGSCPERYCFGDCDKKSATTSVTTGELFISGGNITSKTMTTITGTTYKVTKASTTSRATDGGITKREDERIATALYIAISIFVCVVSVVSLICVARHCRANGWRCKNIPKAHQTDDFRSTLSIQQVPEKNYYDDKYMADRKQCQIYEEVLEEDGQGDQRIYFELNETKMVSVVNKTFDVTDNVEENQQYYNDVVAEDNFPSNKHIEISDTLKLDIEDRTESKGSSAITMNENDKESDFGLKSEHSMETKQPLYMEFTADDETSMNDQLGLERENLKASIDSETLYSERLNLASNYMHLDKNIVKPEETSYTELKSVKETDKTQYGNYISSTSSDNKTDIEKGNFNYEKLKKQDMQLEAVEYTELEGIKGSLTNGHERVASTENNTNLLTSHSLQNKSASNYEKLEINNVHSNNPVYTELKNEPEMCIKDNSIAAE